MSQISHILFDLGRVLVGVDGLPSMRVLFPDLTDFQIQKKFTGESLREEFETGKISTPEFLTRALQEFGLELKPEEFHDLLRSWVVGVYPGVSESLSRLRRQFKIGCLSNTNEIHAKRYHELGLLAHFDDVFLSHEIGFLKPDEGAFQCVLNSWGVDPSEILFFDDNEENVEAARNVGVRAERVEGIGEIEGKVNSIRGKRVT